jgi:protein involved in polysaccharide export with SLBB domain
MRVDANNPARSPLQARASKGANANEVDRDTTSAADKERLDELWRARSMDAASDQDYPVGPGDILIISVPSIEEL